MAAIVEIFADDKGLVWPHSVAPFRVHLLRLGDNEQTVSSADSLYQSLSAAGVDTLYDDRPLRPGEKFADAELMGMPVRVVVSDKTVEAGKLEVVDRATGETRMQSAEELLAELAA